MLGLPCSEKGGTSQKRPRGRTRNRNSQKSKEWNRDRGHELRKEEDAEVAARRIHIRVTRRKGE
jgi:hypothetical protein